MFVTTCVYASGTTSGHYTAYCKHPLSGDWHQYNDESTCQQLPRDDDLTHAYVLFYQRQGTQLHAHDASLTHCFFQCHRRPSV